MLKGHFGARIPLLKHDLFGGDHTRQERFCQKNCLSWSIWRNLFNLDHYCEQFIAASKAKPVPTQRFAYPNFSQRWMRTDPSTLSTTDRDIDTRKSHIYIYMSKQDKMKKWGDALYDHFLIFACFSSPFEGTRFMNAFEETIIYESQKIGGSKIETRFLLDARFNQKNSGSFYIFLHLPVFHNKKTKSAIPPFHCARLHL